MKRYWLLTLMLLMTAIPVQAQTPVPDFLNAGGRYEENHPFVTLTGTWNVQTGSVYSSARSVYTDTGIAQFYIQGDALIFYAQVGTGRGATEVCISGVCATYNAYSPTTGLQVPFLISGFSYGIHEVTMRRLTGAWMDLDAIEVLDTRVSSGGDILIEFPTPYPTSTPPQNIIYATIQPDPNNPDEFYTVAYDLTVSAGSIATVVMVTLNTGLLLVGMLFFVTRKDSRK